MAEGPSPDGFSMRFWGVRGSVPSPGASTAGVGGNTSCVLVRVGGHTLILDGGTGLRGAGDALLAESQGAPVRAHVFFSHLHWDHIQGLPFFGPAFLKGSALHCHAGRVSGRTLREALAGQMAFPYFPVKFQQIAENLSFRDVAVREQVHLDGGVSVYGVEGNHPDGVFAWRIEYKGHALVYATDTEPSPHHEAALIALADGADVLVYDAQYTPEEYEGCDGRGGRVGWGHSTMLDGARVARAAGVGTYVLYHHDPGQDDAAVWAKEARARAEFEHSVAAREGLTLDVTRGKAQR